mgnify:FL=1
MKVIIQNRSVYHKYAEVEVSIDKDDYEDYKINNKYGNIQDYLLEKEHLYSDEIDEAISKAEYNFGNGVNEHDGMVEKESDSEWRYECKELQVGGHF